MSTNKDARSTSSRAALGYDELVPVPTIDEVLPDGSPEEVVAEAIVEPQTTPPGKPTTLRDAADSRWVVVPNGFDRDIASIKPDEIVVVTYRFDEHNTKSFFVHQSIVDNPDKMTAFAGSVIDEWFDMIPATDPATSFHTLRLDDIPPDCRKAGIFNISDMEDEVRKLQKLPYLHESPDLQPAMWFRW
jgi:hypothetical protein